jgi:hypothetical protein
MVKRMRLSFDATPLEPFFTSPTLIVLAYASSVFAASFGMQVKTRSVVLPSKSLVEVISSGVPSFSTAWKGWEAVLAENPLPPPAGEKIYGPQNIK